MCGRLVSAQPPAVIAAQFDVDEVVVDTLPPRYNVAPTAVVPAVATTRSGRRLGVMSWGLVPPWADDPLRGPRPANARAETIAEKPLFAEALVRRRSVVPADGFYEWRTSPDGTKQPFYISMTDGSLLALAAVWQRWEGPGSPALVSCAIVTTAANETVRPLHNRMPAVLVGHALGQWLDPSLGDRRSLQSLLRPLPAGALTIAPASRLVNSTANDGPQLLSA
ncbi:MAG: SOS response-associated peptidase [Actinobacteria bacterium]|nr:SOS response-associated peptidase [Actinomycetota bacterium]